MSDFPPSQPDPIAWQNEQIAALWATVRAMAGANNLESAVATGPNGFTVYDPDTGGRAQFFRGRIRFWDDYDTNPDQYGEILVDPGAGINYLRLFPPHSDGTGAENSITIQGRRDGAAGNVWVYTDGQLLLDADGLAFITAATTTISATGSLNLGGDVINLNATEIHPYGMPYTGGGTPIVMEVSGGAPVMKLSSSAAKFKQDIETYEVDPETVLAIRTVLFRDRSAVEERGDDAPQLVGVIADELHDLGLTHFVDYDEAGEVRGARYDRIWIALLSLAKHEHTKRLNLEAENAALKSTLADLTARLEALEAR